MQGVAVGHAHWDNSEGGGTVTNYAEAAGAASVPRGNQHVWASPRQAPLGVVSLGPGAREVSKHNQNGSGAGAGRVPSACCRKHLGCPVLSLGHGHASCCTEGLLFSLQPSLSNGDRKSVV